ncbi:MAG: type II secretion system F family protein [Gammaproteobacteria bacterium]
MSDALQPYQWTGIDARGKRVKGVVEAIDLKDAQLELKKQGVEVITLQLSSESSWLKMKIFTRKKKIKPRDILLFTRYLSTMLAAGLPLVQALDIIGHDQENPEVKAMILSVKSSVEGGKTLAESFSKYPKQFGELYSSLIKAGEKSGTLDKVLNRLGLYLERTEDLKRKIKKALVYPTAIIVVAGLVSLILLLFVVPQFEAMFKSFGGDLPAFTRVVVSLSKVLRSYGWAVLIVSVVGVWWLRRLLQRSAALQRLRDKWILKMYLIGPVLKNGIIARYARTLATTLEAGMPMVESMNSMAAVMGNRIYSEAVLDVCKDMISGRQLSASMRTTKLFPNMAVQMVAVGEASGTLSAMLHKVADYYEEEVNTTVDNLSNLLEPVIMLVLGVVVGSFVVAMYLPIFKMGSLF